MKDKDYASLNTKGSTFSSKEHFLMRLQACRAKFFRTTFYQNSSLFRYMGTVCGSLLFLPISIGASKSTKYEKFSIMHIVFS